jgi:hypothetical protein
VAGDLENAERCINAWTRNIPNVALEPALPTKRRRQLGLAWFFRRGLPVLDRD